RHGIAFELSRPVARAASVVDDGGVARNLRQQALDVARAHAAVACSEYALALGRAAPVAGDEQHHQVIGLRLLAHPAHAFQELLARGVLSGQHLGVELPVEPLALVAYHALEAFGQELPAVLLADGDDVDVAKLLAVPLVGAIRSEDAERSEEQ